MEETFEHTPEASEKSTGAGTTGSGRKKRSIRDIPLVKKTKSLEDKAEKDARKSQVGALKRVRRKAKEDGEEEIDIKRHKISGADSDSELSDVEQAEEAHYEEIMEHEHEDEAKIAATIADKEKNLSPSEKFNKKWEVDKDIPTNIRIRRKSGGGAKKIIAFLVICLLVLAGLGQTIFAKANIVIEAPEQTANIEATTLPEPIAYEALTKNAEKTASVTGLKTITISKKATGTITLYNNFSTDPYELVKTTRVQTANGSIYRLIADVKIPGKSGSNPGTITAKVEADKPGSIYNAAAGLELRLPGLVAGTDRYKNIYAKVASNFTGGQSGTAPDTNSAAIQDAVATIKTESENIAINEFKANHADLIIITDSIETTTSLGTITNSDGVSSVKVRVTTKAIGLSKEQLMKGVTYILAGKKVVPIKDDLASLSYDVSETDTKSLVNGSFNVDVSGTIKTGLSVTPFDLKQEIAKKSVAEADSIISGHIIGAETTISIRPFWKKSIPTSNKIDLIIQ